MHAEWSYSTFPGMPGRVSRVYCITKVLRSDQCSELAKLNANVSFAKAMKLRPATCAVKAKQKFTKRVYNGVSKMS